MFIGEKNEKVKRKNTKRININPKGYPYFDTSFKFKHQQMEFLRENFISDGQVQNKSEFKKYLKDLIKVNYNSPHCKCPLNIVSFAYTKDSKSMRIYGKCLYENDGCRKYKFCIDFCSEPYYVKVFTNKKYISPKT